MGWLSRRLAAVLALSTISACAEQSATAPLDEDTRTSAWLHDAVENRYIVAFSDDVIDAPALARRLTAEHGATLHHTYRYTIRGFAATLPPRAVEALRTHPHIRSIHPDRIATLALNIQQNATWGLDRIDQHDLPLSSTYSYLATGHGVNVYVIDSGIETSHPEFGGRAIVGHEVVQDNGQDCLGHGTHVAGTIGGTTYGVAKGATLIAVRVFGCAGTTMTSTIIAGVDWVTGNHTKPAVANMSLGGPLHSTLDEAVRSSIAAGVTYVVSAGNDHGLDACSKSPARVAEALTVGASTPFDARAAFSNVGSCVDLFAPGTQIMSADLGGTYSQKQGTSMASPHVAGTAALYLQMDPSASPEIVRNAIRGNATAGRLTDIGEQSPNLLVRTPTRRAIHRTYSPAASDHMYGHDPLEGAASGYLLEYRNYFFLSAVWDVNLTALYRCYDPSVVDHFLSVYSDCEGKTYEALLGYIATMQVAGSVPLYRLVNPYTWDHLYTISASERQHALNSGWVDEGISGFVFSEW